jgi:hypothetical protein
LSVPFWWNVAWLQFVNVVGHSDDEPVESLEHSAASVHRAPILVGTQIVPAALVGVHLRSAAQPLSEERHGWPSPPA